MLVCKSFEFDAAHQLPNHNGKCRNLHGHREKIEFGLEGPVRPLDGSPSEGMVRDFGDVVQVWETSLKPRLDHQFLNEWLEVPTAERMAIWAFGIVRAEIPELVLVRVWETPSSHVEYRGE